VSVTASRGSDWVEIRVVDDGPGVPVADHDAVFLPFVRRDPHRGRAQGGAGLGLAIVNQIVTAHGGSVVIRDASPGAIFAVRLPLSDSSQARIGTVDA
jgi:signal transduction histidine kinase